MKGSTSTTVGIGTEFALVAIIVLWIPRIRFEVFQVQCSRRQCGSCSSCSTPLRSPSYQRLHSIKISFSCAHTDAPDGSPERMEATLR